MSTSPEQRDELRELVKWMKNNKVDYLLYISGDFNQADVAFLRLE